MYLLWLVAFFNFIFIFFYSPDCCYWKFKAVSLFAPYSKWASWDTDIYFLLDVHVTACDWCGSRYTTLNHLLNTRFQYSRFKYSMWLRDAFLNWIWTFYDYFMCMWVDWDDWSLISEHYTIQAPVLVKCLTDLGIRCECVLTHLGSQCWFPSVIRNNRQLLSIKLCLEIMQTTRPVDIFRISICAYPYATSMSDVKWKQACHIAYETVY